ncbi:MAG: PAS domain-containing protein [Candidatus Taylorbacteria bacterium]|nr:PAS domain-containing protein [Candidatus Taylorbacteria bacterium]
MNTAHIWEAGMVYVKTVVDIEHEPFLILDEKLHVIAGNDMYYKTFKLTQKQVDGKSIYKLGKGEWNIASLRNKLEGVAVNGTFLKGFEVTLDFKNIGRRTMMVNARRIYAGPMSVSLKSISPMILFAMEDITEMISVAEQLTSHVTTFEGL